MNKQNKTKQMKDKKPSERIGEILKEIAKEENIKNDLLDISMSFTLVFPAIVEAIMSYLDEQHLKVKKGK